MLREHERTLHKLRCDLGPIYSALCNPDVMDVWRNSDGNLWVETFSGKEIFGKMSAPTAQNLINTIASISNAEVTPENPILSGELWIDIEGALKRFRFQAEIPPVVTGPSINIRKPAGRVIPLSDYLKDEVITPSQAEALSNAIAKRQSILVVGATQSGKTTFCNALLDEMARQFPKDRVIIIEDTGELQCNVEDTETLTSTDAISMDRLLKCCMRKRPDRIVVGEVRGPEAYSLIKAWNTGHPGGISTIHSNSAETALLRLEQLISESNIDPCPAGIIEAVNIIVYITKVNFGKARRQVQKILRVEGYDPRRGYIFKDLG